MGDETGAEIDSRRSVDEFPTQVVDSLGIGELRADCPANSSAAAAAATAGNGDSKISAVTADCQPFRSIR
jgi:hypothetical protein